MMKLEEAQGDLRTIQETIAKMLMDFNDRTGLTINEVLTTKFIGTIYEGNSTYPDKVNYSVNIKVEL